jgi:hypothetical protein
MYFTFYVLQHLLPDEYSLSFGPPPAPSQPTDPTSSESDFEETNWVVLEESTGGITSDHEKSRSKSPRKKVSVQDNSIKSDLEVIEAVRTKAPATAFPEPDDATDDSPAPPSPSISSSQPPSSTELDGASAPPANTNAPPPPTISEPAESAPSATTATATITDVDQAPQQQTPVKKHRSSLKPESIAASAGSTSPAWRRSKLATSLDELRQVRKQRLFELSSKFLSLYAAHIEPVFKKSKK